MVAVVAAKSFVVLDPPDADALLAILVHHPSGESLRAGLVLSPDHTTHRLDQGLDVLVVSDAHEHAIANAHVVQEIELPGVVGVLGRDRDATFDFHVHLLLSS